MESNVYGSANKSLAAVKSIDFIVRQALLKASSPPFLGLLEISEADRIKAQDAIITFGNRDMRTLASVLRKHQNFAAWYLCDTVRRTYGSDGTARVWPDIAVALGLPNDLPHPFRHELHEIVALRCERLGLPVPTEDRVSLFRLHAGVSEAQLPALVQAFLSQEQSLGLPSLDDGNALNDWEDRSLHFVPAGLSVLRMPILWDVTAWHALMFAQCRLGISDPSSRYRDRLGEVIDRVKKNTGSPIGRHVVAPRPRLILSGMEVALQLPMGTGRHLIAFDDDSPLRVRSGSILPIPKPLPHSIYLGDDFGALDLLPMPGDVLVGDLDAEGDLIQLRRQGHLTMSHVILFAREAISTKQDVQIDCYEVADGLYCATCILPQSQALQLLVGDAQLVLERRPHRRISMRGDGVGRGPSGILYGPDSLVLVQTGITTSSERDLSIRLGTGEPFYLQVTTNASGECEIPLLDLLQEAGLSLGGAPQAVRIELMRPVDMAGIAPVGSGVRMRADIWLGFKGRSGAELLCDVSPANLNFEKSVNIAHDERGYPCIVTDRPAAAQIAFDIEAQCRAFTLLPSDLRVTHILPDGTSSPLSIGGNLLLTPETRGGAIRLESADTSAIIELPGGQRFTPFWKGGSSTLSLRATDTGWIRLHRQDGHQVDLFELRNAFAYSDVTIERRFGAVVIRIEMEDTFDAVKAEVEMEMGQIETGEIHFGEVETNSSRPDWMKAHKTPNGILQVELRGEHLPPGTWLGRLQVRDASGWHPIIADRGDTLTFILSRGIPEDANLHTAERLKRVLSWLNLCHSLESWKAGAVGAALSNRRSVLVEHLESIPDGRSKLLSLCLTDTWFSAGSSWMPPMHAFNDCPRMFEGPLTNFHATEGMFGLMARIGGERLRNLQEIDVAALFAFKNASQASRTGAPLEQFEFSKLMTIISSDTGKSGRLWSGDQLLGPSHWRAGHILLQDRLDETLFFGADADGNNGHRSLKLRQLHSLLGRNLPPLPVPHELPDEQKQLHCDLSQILREFSCAARSKRTVAWLTELTRGTEHSPMPFISALGDIVRLAPELFAFHLLAAELERRI